MCAFDFLKYSTPFGRQVGYLLENPRVIEKNVELLINLVSDVKHKILEPVKDWYRVQSEVNPEILHQIFGSLKFYYGVRGNMLITEEFTGCRYSRRSNVKNQQKIEKFRTKNFLEGTLR